MATPKPRVKLPKSVAAGVPFTVKTRITHPMHTGLTHDGDGNPVPRRIINRLAVRFNGELAMYADLEPAVSADPYVEFEMAVVESGQLEFEWVEDDGSVYGLSREIEVE